MNRLKIAYMLGTFPAISETFIMREIEKIVNQGFDVSIFAVRRSDNMNIERSLCNSDIIRLCSYARPDNVINQLISNIKNIVIHPVLYLSTLKIFLNQIFRVEPPIFFRILYHFFCGIGFSDLIHKKGINHIHCHFSTGSNMGLAASQFLRIAFSFTAHASGDIFVKPILLKQKLERASFIVAVCEYSRKYLDSITGYKYSKKIFRIYNSIDVSEAEKLLVSKRRGHEGLNTVENKIRIVSVGSLIGCKGYATLLDSLRILIERGYRITCEIIGDGPERENLTTLIKEWHLQDTIIMNGYAPLQDVYEALAKADFFVLLSEIHKNGYRDGFPTVILEAMLMSLPVISTWISGIPEMVINGKTGFLVHERDPIGAANAIEILINDESLRSSFGGAGRQRVIEMFNLSKNVRSLAELFFRNLKE